MAISNNGSNSLAHVAFAADPGTTVLSWSHTVPAGTDRYLIVAYEATSDLSASTVTFGAASMTFLGRVSGAANRHVEIWGLINPAVSTDTITITIPFWSRVVLGQAANYIGVDQTTPVGAGGSSTSGNDAAPTCTVTSATGDMVVAAVGQWRGSGVTEGLTVGAGQTSRGEDVFNESTNAIMHGGISEEAGAASVVMSYTSDQSDIWGMVGIPLKPSSGGVSAGIAIIPSLEKYPPQPKIGAYA